MNRKGFTGISITIIYVRLICLYTCIMMLIYEQLIEKKGHHVNLHDCKSPIHILTVICNIIKKTFKGFRNERNVLCLHNTKCN